VGGAKGGVADIDGPDEIAGLGLEPVPCWLDEEEFVGAVPLCGAKPDPMALSF